MGDGVDPGRTGEIIYRLPLELAQIQVVVEPPPGEELPVGPPLDDPPVIDHQQLVGVPDRAQAVRDHEAGPPCHQVQERLLDAGLGAGVDAAGRLVEDQDRRVREDRPGDGEELPLPLAQIPGPLREDRLVALGELADEADRRRPSSPPRCTPRRSPRAVRSGCSPARSPRRGRSPGGRSPDGGAGPPSGSSGCPCRRS